MLSTYKFIQKHLTIFHSNAIVAMSPNRNVNARVSWVRNANRLWSAKLQATAYYLVHIPNFSSERGTSAKRQINNLLQQRQILG